MQKLPESISKNKDFFNERLIEKCRLSPEIMAKAEKIGEVISTMAKTYEQDGKGDEAIAYLHYQIRHPGYRSSDWYITEKDVNEQQHQAYGLVNLTGNKPELGYISLIELADIGLIELDLDFTPMKIGEIRAQLAS